MLPNKYLAAMIGKSSSGIGAVSCMCQLLSNQCPPTFRLIIQMLPVNFLAAAELPWGPGCAVAIWLSLR